MVTMQDVADAAGVSKATVSYVVSGSPLISEKTASRVRAEMEKLGYSINHAARVLSTSKTGAIGVLSSAEQNASFSLSLSAYLYGIARAAGDMGYDTMLLAGADGASALKSAALTKRIDGAIILDVRNGDSRIRAAVQSGLPTVLLGDPEDSMGLDSVDADFEEISSTLVNYLYRYGHRDLIFIGWPKMTYERRLNYAIRFRSAMVERAQALGMKIHCIYPENSMADLLRRLKRAVEEYGDATAILIHNDAAVIEVSQAFLSLNIKIPEDFSVVAVIPDKVGVGMQIPFTAMNLDINAIVKRTVGTLVHRIESPDGPARRVLVGQHLLLADSVKRISR
ncbi:LacI family DNA-binding transcriptional regulator [Bifidobacterium sp. ESL0784]|uniref:LacI family DNA-binding transcriptional regulator n=1 Tax=Bifidobacterium sp. ESL0784 TaxID=2983231 RepID=UPI0023F7F944|nr:LacI family DNA-binding transcriptional regulator [Bifidobacterium sp. ESL0784]MDF7640804.1 LacI family DNA-binding transcriptional regulator [Bifidobacterium sp. ESL0784]